MGDYLDLNGVAYVWEKVQELVAATVMQPATPSQAGIVTIDTQWLGGTKGAEGFTTLGNFAVYRSNEGGSTNRLGRIYIDRNTVNSKEVTNHFIFRQYSPDSSGDMKTYSEMYLLPDVAADMSANGTYNILTSKSAVTIGQGGTGATSASDARTALGVVCDTLFSGTFNSSSSAATLTNGMDYNWLMLLGRPGDSYNACVVAAVPNITTNAVNYQLAGQSNYFCVSLKKESSTSNNVTMTYVNTSSTADGRVLRVYGLR